MEMEQHGQGAPSPNVDSSAVLPDWTCVLGAAALVTAAASARDEAHRNIQWLSMGEYEVRGCRLAMVAPG